MVDLKDYNRLMLSLLWFILGSGRFIQGFIGRGSLLGYYRFIIVYAKVLGVCVPVARFTAEY